MAVSSDAWDVPYDASDVPHAASASDVPRPARALPLSGTLASSKEGRARPVSMVSFPRPLPGARPVTGQITGARTGSLAGPLPVSASPGVAVDRSGELLPRKVHFGSVASSFAPVQRAGVSARHSVYAAPVPDPRTAAGAGLTVQIGGGGTYMEGLGAVEWVAGGDTGNASARVEVGVKADEVGGKAVKSPKLQALESKFGSGFRV